MSEKHDRFVAAYPDVHPSARERFPFFDYRKPLPGTIVDFSNPANCTGHQQRCVTTWWAIEKGSPLDPGLDLGSPKGLTPFAIHVDAFGWGTRHPQARYAGSAKYSSDIVHDAARIGELVPEESLPFIASNHSLEHMPPVGDDGAIIEMLSGWMKLLRRGGVLAMVVPDNDFVDVLRIDADHKNAWGGGDFERRILDPLMSRGHCHCHEFNTLSNRFSFNVILERT